MQTAIIITTDDHELLVRTFDCHIPATNIAVDWRLKNTMLSERWSPIARDRVEIRHENVPIINVTQRGRDLDYLAELLRQGEFADALVEGEVAAGLEIIDRLRAEQ